MDNLMAMILTLGSPTLAGYSLYITLLNARWLNEDLFSGADYPSVTVRRAVVQVLNSLQQVPLRVHPGRSGRFESLVVHPDNDKWWITLAQDLDFSHRWSIASATSIAWVVLAYLFTVAASLCNTGSVTDPNGQGTGSVLLWLLPVIVGWLVLSPKCDYNRVHAAYQRANTLLFVANSLDHTTTHIAHNTGLTINPSPGWKLHHRNITSPDEEKIPPVFNYAKTLEWCRNAYATSLFYRAASRKSSRGFAVDGGYIPMDVNEIPRESRLGNREQIIQYCRPDDHEYSGIEILWPRGIFFNMIVASLMSLQLQWGTTAAAILAVWFNPTIGLGCRSLAYVIYGMISAAVWILLLSSSMLGYYAHHLVDALSITDLESDEQCTTTVGNTSSAAGSGYHDGVAIPLREFPSPDFVTEEGSPFNTDEPTNITTIKYAHPGWILACTISHVADWLRWIGKSLAVFNAIGIVASSVFLFTGVYNNCYCDSNVHTQGLSSVFSVVYLIQSNIDLARSAWIGTLTLSLC